MIPSRYGFEGWMCHDYADQFIREGLVGNLKPNAEYFPPAPIVGIDLDSYHAMESLLPKEHQIAVPALDQHADAVVLITSKRLPMPSTVAGPTKVKILVDITGTKRQSDLSSFKNSLKAEMLNLGTQSPLSPLEPGVCNPRAKDPFLELFRKFDLGGER